MVFQVNALYLIDNTLEEDFYNLNLAQKYNQINFP